MEILKLTENFNIVLKNFQMGLVDLKMTKPDDFETVIF